MTQSKLAEILDYTNERQLQRIENGESGCSIDKLMEIAQILNITTDYLLFGIEKDKGICFFDEQYCRTEEQRIFMRKIMKIVIEYMEFLIIGN